MRLFYALLPSEREKQQLQMQQRKISAVAESGRDTATENLHMTLQFLGEVPPERLGLLKKILTQAAQNVRPFSITLRDYGWFDGKGQERLWYLTGSSPEAAALSEKLGEVLKQNGFAVENRDFLPHITLVRRCRMPEGVLPEPPEPVTIQVQRVWLMESQQIRGSVVYVPIFHVGLI